MYKKWSDFDHSSIGSKCFFLEGEKMSRQFCLKGDGTTDTMGTKKHVCMKKENEVVLMHWGSLRPERKLGYVCKVCQK